MNEHWYGEFDTNETIGRNVSMTKMYQWKKVWNLKR